MSCFNFKLKLLSELKSLKLSKAIKFRGAEGKLDQKFVSRYSHGQNVWDKSQFSCELGYYGKVPFPFLRSFLLVLKKQSILGKRLSTRL